MKKLLFLGACLVALASQPVMAQTTAPEIVVVRVTEDSRHVYVSITRADGKSEQLKFDNGAIGEGLDKSGQGYQKLFATLYQQGYRLQSTFSATAATSDDRTTLLFVKGQ
jgi:opacity protein-like surface antigen